MRKIKRKILFYDIETAPLKAWVWRTGKQFVSHDQLEEGHDRYDIICIGYEWQHSNRGGVLDWGYKEQDSKPMIEEFTEICSEADIIIGKNNKSFDDKHMNTMRLLHQLGGRPDLLSKVDDLQTQMKRHFFLPSYGLDYFSKMLGFGGKTPMERQDWIDIVTQSEAGEAKLRKMKKYCRKDVRDTKGIWNYCESHMSPRENLSAIMQDMRCIKCGSENLKKNGTRVDARGQEFQSYFCLEGNHYAGRIPVNAKKIYLRN